MVAGTPGSAINDSSSTDPATHIFPTETLWVAAKSRRVTIYGLVSQEKKELTSFTAHESVAVIKVLNEKVFFGEILLCVVAAIYKEIELFYLVMQ